MRPGVILLVEDDPNDVLLLQRALNRARLRQEIRVARDGQEAIAYLEGSGPYADREANPLPCLILLDFKLPRKNGLEVLGWLRGRQDLLELPVVMISSSAEAKDREEAIRKGVEAYRVKPVSFDELVRLAEEIHARAELHCGPATPPEGA